MHATLMRMGEARLGTIGLIHGSGHRPEHWDLLRPELEARGFDTIAVNLPADDPQATYTDYARRAAEAFSPAIQNGARIDIIAHSGGAHTVPETVRLLGSNAIRTITYISGSIGEEAISTPDDSADPESSTTASRIPRPRNSEDFRNATLRLENGLIIFDPSQVEKLFFGDCEPERFVWALGLMRPQGRPTDEPPLSAHRLPGIHKAYVLPTGDRIRNEQWAIETARWLGMHLLRIEGGHSPAISRPGELADLIEKEIKSVLSSEKTRPLPPAASYLNIYVDK